MFQAILFALAVTLFGNFFNTPYLLCFAAFFPLTAGTIAGIALGDPMTGLITGGYIQLAYLGWVTAGGSLPSNNSLAAFYGTALVILTKADPATGPALAIPVGLLGVFVHQAQMTLDAFFVHRADKYAEQGNFTGIIMMNTLAPMLLNLVIYGIPSFLLVYFGASHAPQIFQSIPEWLINGLVLVGGLMPALGIGMLLKYIGKKHLLPYFFIGYFLVTFLKLNLNAIAILGALIALIFYYITTKEGALSHVRA